MPMEADELSEMESLIAVARKRELNFAVCMGKKPEGTIFYMHRKKDYGILARNAKKAGESAKLAFGTCSVKGKKILMTCMEDPPPAMARQMKMFLKENGLPFKVSILDRFGDELDSDGEDDEDMDLASAPPGPMEEEDEQGTQRQPGPEETSEQSERYNTGEAADELGRKWTALVAQMSPLYTKAMATNPPNRTQLEAAWAMANEKADAGDYKTAMTIAAKIRPTLVTLAETAQEEEDPFKAKWEKAREDVQPLLLKALDSNPPNRTQLEAAWAMANEKADTGDFKTAMTIVDRIKPNLASISDTTEEDSAPEDPAAAEWKKLSSEIEGLYTEAMKTKPAEGSKMQAAWAMATEKADGGDYTAATTIANRLRPLLEQAINAGNGAGSEIPVNVVAFQKSRIEWISTRRAMLGEMKKLETAIQTACNDVPELAPVAARVGDLSKRLDVFDTRLDDILEEITVTADGEKRESLKKDAVGAITEYRNALNSDFFKDLDSDNGFTNVNVAAAANASLANIAKTLAG